MEDNSYAELIEESIKEHFERNGTLDEMRSGLHVKVLKMLREQTKLKKNEPLCGGDMEQRGLLYLLNQLIVDYFYWYGYKHTLETFALETGKKSKPKSREKLQEELKDKFEHNELPILLQMLMKQTNKDDDNKFTKPKLQPITTIKPKPIKPKTIPNPPPKPIKVEKLHTPNSTINNINRPQVKVNVRQRMADTDRPFPIPRKRKQPKIEEKVTTTIQKQTPKSYETDSSSNTTESSDDDNSAYDSDAYAEIPNRYYYREQEPPEKTYPDGFGEEGPYVGKPKPKMGNPSSSSPFTKRKGLQIYELQNKEKPHCSKRETSKQMSDRSKTLDRRMIKRSRSKFLFHSQRRADRSDDELDLPVMKPKCPETVVSAMRLNSAEDSDEDSDNYL